MFSSLREPSCDCCDCKDPTQCWEPCGELGNDEDFASVSEDSDVINQFLKEHSQVTNE